VPGVIILAVGTQITALQRLIVLYRAMQVDLPADRRDQPPP